MKRYHIITFLLGGFLLLEGSTPVEAEKLTIAVLDLNLKGAGLTKGAVDSMSRSVRYLFSEKESLNLLSWDKMVEGAKKKGLSLSRCADIPCAVRLGKVFSVQKVVMGSVAKFGNRCSLSLRVVDVGKGIVECRKKAEIHVRMNSEEADPVMDAVEDLSRCILIEKAREEFSLSPKDAKAYYRLGFELEDQQEYGEAEKAYREAVRLNPDYFEAHYTLANMLALTDRTKCEAAEKEYREVIRLKPDEAEAYTRMAQMLLWQKKDVEAVKAYREVIRLKPNDAWLQQQLGNTLEMLQQYEEAEKEYREAARLNPDSAPWLEKLALFLDTHGKRKDAREYWVRAAKNEKRPFMLELIKKRLEEPE